MKKVLFVGSTVPENLKGQIEINSEAANNFQINLISELKKEFQITILSYYGYKMKKLENIKSDNFKYIYKYDLFNMKIIKKIIEIKKMIKESEIIIFYNHSYFNDFLNFLISKSKKKYLILADYTEPFEEKNLIKKLLSLKAKNEFKKYFGLICLSKNMLKYNKNSVNIFGGIDGEKFKEFLSPVTTERIKVFYSGVLNEVTGIDLLIEAIGNIKEKNVEFFFTGKGSLEGKIKDAALKDKRIKYLGFLSKMEFYNKLEESNILINPRNMNLLQNRNNFPSKILEYLHTGRIILSTKFPGYDEFKENIIFCESNSKSIEEHLEKILREYKNKKNITYQINKKKSKEFTWEKQGEIIKKFINI